MSWPDRPPGPNHGPPPGWGHAPPPASGRPPGAFASVPSADGGATRALVLGIIAVAGGLSCYLPLVVAPFAWVAGHRARSRIRASQGALSGEGLATAGWILGIIGTVLLVLAVVVLVVVVAVGLSGGFDDPTPTYDDGGLDATLSLLIL